MNINMSLAERLVHARKASRFANTKQAAEAAGITPSALYQLESGKTKSLAGDTAERLARIYTDFRIEWLISGRGHAAMYHLDESVWASSKMAEPVESQDLGISPERLSASIKLIRLACEQLEVNFNPEEDGKLIVLAYQYLGGLSEDNVTPENLVDFTKRLRQKSRDAGDDVQQLQSGTTGGSASGEGKPLYIAKF